MDPYVKMHVGSRVFKTRTHIDGGKNPTWNDEFNFKRTTEEYVTIYIYDEDDITSDDLVCEGKFMLSSVCGGMSNSFSNNIPMFYKGKNAGELFLNVVFQPDVVGIAMQPAIQVTTIPGTYVVPAQTACIIYCFIYRCVFCTYTNLCSNLCSNLCTSILTTSSNLRTHLCSSTSNRLSTFLCTSYLCSNLHSSNAILPT